MADSIETALKTIIRRLQRLEGRQAEMARVETPAGIVALATIAETKTGTNTTKGTTPADIRATTERVINIHDTTYGVVADGVTDDYAAIQAAVTAASGHMKIVFDGSKSYYIGTKITISHSNIVLDGNGCTINFDFHNPDNYADPTNHPVFYVKGSVETDDPLDYDVYNVKIGNFSFVNVGATAGATDDTGYWETLNSASAEYDRRYNKYYNCDPCVCYAYATDVIVENCRARQPGTFVSYAGYAGRAFVRNNFIYDWGKVGISAGAGSVIEGNYLDNSGAPMIDTTDRETYDIGTSHAIYVSGGNDSVIVRNNYIKKCRSSSIKFDSTSVDFDRIIIEGNIMDTCSWGLYIGPVLNVLVANNFFHDTGESQIVDTDTHFQWVGNYHLGCMYGVRSDGGKLQVAIGNYNYGAFLSNSFDDPGASADLSPAIQISGTGRMIIKGNTFHQNYKYGFYAYSKAAEIIDVTENTFYCKNLIEYSVDASVITFARNTFDMRSGGEDYFINCQHSGVVIDSNLFLLANGKYGIAIDDQGAGIPIITNNTFIGPPSGTGYSINAADMAGAEVIWEGNRYVGAVQAVSFAGKFLTTTGYGRQYESRLSMNALTTEPSGLANGDLIYADGTSWNPGAGEGIYSREGGAWEKLSSKGAVGAGAVVSGKCTAVERGNEAVHQTTLTFTLTGANDLDLADGADHGTGVKVYDFPAGRIYILGVVMAALAHSNDAFNADPNDIYYVSCGTATAGDDGTLSGTEANLAPSYTVDTAGNTNFYYDWLDYLASPATFDGTSSAIDIYVNAAVADTSTTKAVTIAITGTMTITWINLGDY